MRRRRIRAVGLIALAVALLAAAAIGPLRHAGHALIVNRVVSSPEVIVMLASHEWERLPAVAALARQHPNASVLITEPATVNQYNCHRCGERVAWFQAEGVAPSRVTVLRRIVNTQHEATAVLEYWRGHPFNRLLVVTSPYHTRRALATFARAFDAEDVQVGVVPAAGGRAQPDRWWLDPYDRFYVRYEWAAILKYRLIYGVPML